MVISVVVVVVMVVIVVVVVVVVIVDGVGVGVGVVDVVDIVVVVGMIELPPNQKTKRNSKFWFFSQVSRINRHSCYFHTYSLGVLLIYVCTANLLIFTEVSLTA